jgi:hypothetical protein
VKERLALARTKMTRTEVEMVMGGPCAEVQIDRETVVNKGWCQQTPTSEWVLVWRRLVGCALAPSELFFSVGIAGPKVVGARIPQIT